MSFSGGAVRLVRHNLESQPSMEFLGALMCGDSSAPWGHRGNRRKAVKVTPPNLAGGPIQADRAVGRRSRCHCGGVCFRSSGQVGPACPACSCARMPTRKLCARSRAVDTGSGGAAEQGAHTNNGWPRSQVGSSNSWTIFVAVCCPACPWRREQPQRGPRHTFLRVV